MPDDLIAAAAIAADAVNDIAIDPAVKAKVDDLMAKDVGGTFTLSIQRKRRITGLALDIAPSGSYGLIISFQETQVDQDGNTVQTFHESTTVADKELSKETKAAMDAVYTAAIAAL